MNIDPVEPTFSQVENDLLCTAVNYSPWTLRRTPCPEEAVRSIGYDDMNHIQFRYCQSHWYDLERALLNEIVLTPQPQWQYVRDHIITSATSRILAIVLREGSKARKRRVAGQRNIAQVIESKITGSIVYFMQAGDDGPVKIGTTNSVFSRFSSLQTGSPVILHLRAFQAGDRKTERQYHEVFAPHRISGEWFEPVPKLLATIAAINAQQA